jgi:hypothetical protein
MPSGGRKSLRNFPQHTGQLGASNIDKGQATISFSIGLLFALNNCAKINNNNRKIERVKISQTCEVLIHSCEKVYKNMARQR